MISTHYSDDVISLLIRMRADSACTLFDCMFSELLLVLFFDLSDLDHK